MRAVANVEDAFVAAVEAMPESFRECRSGQHRMNVTDRLRIIDSAEEDGRRPIRGEKVYATRVVECDRCGKVRHDYFRISSRRGHQYLEKIGVYYEKLDGYDIVGLGVIPGSRGFILGLGLQMPEQPVRGRGRPRKVAQ